MKAKRRQPVIILAILIAIIFSINLLGFCNGTRKIFNVIFAPAQKVLWKAGEGVSGFFENIFTLSSYKKENEKLVSYNKELMGRVAELKKTREENEFLRNALDLKLKESFEMSLAQVISKEMFGDIILVSIEKDKKISNESPVLSKDKIVCGRVSKIYGNTAEVSLISDRANTFAVEILVEDGITEGVLRGKGKFEAYIDLIPKEKNVKEGDMVITSVLGNAFPEGLVVGTIKKVIRDDANPYLIAEISPACTIGDLNNLLIIDNFK